MRIETLFCDECKAEGYKLYKMGEKEYCHLCIEDVLWGKVICWAGFIGMFFWRGYCECGWRSSTHRDGDLHHDVVRAVQKHAKACGSEMVDPPPWHVIEMRRRERS